jgi:hypothetical protein
VADEALLMAKQRAMGGVHLAGTTDIHSPSGVSLVAFTGCVMASTLPLHYAAGTQAGQRKRCEML